jgi:hypothetical protein
MGKVLASLQVSRSLAKDKASKTSLLALFAPRAREAIIVDRAASLIGDRRGAIPDRQTKQTPYAIHCYGVLFHASCDF